MGRDPITGKRRTKWHTIRGTKRDAERERNRLLYELDEGLYVEPTPETVKAYLPRWLAHVGPNVRATTLQRYREIVEHHLIPAIGHHQLAKLKPIQVSDAWANALANGRRDGKGRPVGADRQAPAPRAEPSVEASRSLANHRAQTPATPSTPPRPQRQEMTIVSDDEAARLLNAIAQTRMHLPVLLAVTTGMRRGEILGMRWRDVELDGAALSVSQTLEHTKDGLKFAPPKTAPLATADQPAGAHLRSPAPSQGAPGARAPGSRGPEGRRRPCRLPQGRRADQAPVDHSRIHPPGRARRRATGPLSRSAAYPHQPPVAELRAPERSRASEPAMRR